jgi:GTP-binding protein
MIKNTSFKNTSFVKTAMQPKDYPVVRDDRGALLPEVAVAGRSNVGKSSLLNHLFDSKGLVKTSSMPGKTQALNFFNTDNQLLFVDLPGYGYAKVSLETKKKWGPMIQTYLQTRQTLALILFLFDIRRVPTEEDIQFLNWAIDAKKAIILVLTKVDKVTVNEKRANTDRILRAFNKENLHCVHYSVTKNVGRKELTGMLKEAFSGETSWDV